MSDLPVVIKSEKNGGIFYVSLLVIVTWHCVFVVEPVNEIQLLRLIFNFWHFDVHDLTSLKRRNKKMF